MTSLEAAGCLRFSFPQPASYHNAVGESDVIVAKCHSMSQLDNAINTKLLFQQDPHTQLFHSMRLAYTVSVREMWSWWGGGILRQQVEMGVIAGSVLLFTVFI